MSNITTHNLTGEVYNYSYDSSGKIKCGFKQTWEIVLDKINFKWIVKSCLYTKLLEDSSTEFSGIYYQDIWIRNGINIYSLSNGSDDSALNVNSENGVTVNGITISTDAVSQYVKIMEKIDEYDCTAYGRRGLTFACGNTLNNIDYYFYEYEIVNVQTTFSGIRYKRRGIFNPSSIFYVRAMPWLKVNGVWKRVYAYVKVNNKWQEPYDEW